MDGIFKISGKEDVIGRLRNIYSKMKKNKTLGKTKYIKRKGEFIRLSIYIKENKEIAKKGQGKQIVAKAAKAAKASSAKRSILKKHRKITVIDNINDIKDTKIRHLFLKTFKKNSKIYIYSDNKRWKGGGIETYGHVVTQNNGTDRGTHDLSELTPPVIKSLPYIDDIDGIIAKIIQIGTKISTTAAPNLFEQISNMIYNISVDGNDYSIRPYVSIKGDRFIIYFYINVGSNWIKLPIHITLFLRDMFSYANASQINIKTGFLHITCEDRIIFKKLEGSTKLHLYLNGKNFDELSKIMKKHGEKMFKDCGYDTGNTDIKVEKYKPNLTTYVPNTIWGTLDGMLKLDDVPLKKSINHIIQNHLPEIIRHIFMMFDKETTNISTGILKITGIVTEDVSETNSDDTTNTDYVHISLDYFKDTSEHNIRYTQSYNIKRSYKFYMNTPSSQTRGRSGYAGTPRSGSRPRSAMHVDSPIDTSRPHTSRSRPLSATYDGSLTSRSGSRPHSAMHVDSPIDTSRPHTPISRPHSATYDGSLTSRSESRPHTAPYIDPSRDTHRPPIPRFDIPRIDTSGDRSGFTYRDTGDYRSGDRSGYRSGDTSGYRSGYRSGDTSGDTSGYRSGDTYRATGDYRSGDRSGDTYRARGDDRGRMRDTRGYRDDGRSPSRRSPSRR